MKFGGANFNFTVQKAVLALRRNRVGGRRNLVQSYEELLWEEVEVLETQDRRRK